MAYTQDSKWRNTLWNAIQRGQTVGSANETGPVQTLQMQRNAFQLANFESWKSFGFAASEPDGSDVLFVAPSGDASTAVIIASNNGTHRPTGMLSGETQIYDAFNDSIYFQQAKVAITHQTEIDLVIGTTLVAKFTASGINLYVPLVSNSDGTFNGVSVHNHIHSGVQTGDGDTGEPVT